MGSATSDLSTCLEKKFRTLGNHGTATTVDVVEHHEAARQSFDAVHLLTATSTGTSLRGSDVNALPRTGVVKEVVDLGFDVRHWFRCWEIKLVRYDGVSFRVEAGAIRTSVGVDATRLETGEFHLLVEYRTSVHVDLGTRRSRTSRTFAEHGTGTGTHGTADQSFLSCRFSDSLRELTVHIVDTGCVVLHQLFRCALACFLGCLCDEASTSTATHRCTTCLLEDGCEIPASDGGEASDGCATDQWCESLCLANKFLLGRISVASGSLK